MLKKLFLMVAAGAFSLTLCACGGSGAGGEDTSASTEGTQTEEYDPMVDSIDLSLEKGEVRFVRAEKANAELTDSSSALVFVFEFTNKQSAPAQVQSVFQFQFFQNGAELSDNLSYSSTGGEQYELVSSFFDDAMKDGTVTFGRLVEPEDDSPVTIMVNPNGAPLEDNYQTMEFDIADLDGSPVETASASPEQINAMLQGSWSVEGSGTFTFDRGIVTVDAPGAAMAGTYEVDTASSTIVGNLETADGTVRITIPYEYDGTVLKVFNNRNVAMIKM